MALEFSQFNFLGGMNQQLDATKVAQLGDSYFLGINVRNRDNTLSPIRCPKDLSQKFVAGKLQGLYGAGSLLLLFVDGKPWIWDVSGPGGFVPLVAEAMDKDVDYIYAEFVPGSTLGYARFRAPQKNNDGTVTKEDNVTLDINQELPFISSVQGVIYQDGKNQARIIFGDGNDRALNNYAQWTINNREYVPVMKQMLYYNGILFGISPDGTQIYRSVTGKPIDFVVPINEDGDKTSSVEEDGGAPSLSHKVDFEAATAIKASPTDNAFIVTTINRTFLVGFNYDITYFDEPSFDTFPVASSGAVNQFCFADLNGDTGIINLHGIHSFNAAATLKQESSNDPVSGIIGRLFKLSDDQFVTQDFPCAFDFGADYSLFAVNTIYGRGVLIYDKIAQKFVSLDIYSGVSQIKQFANVVVNGIRRLFFITIDNKFYEAFAGGNIETAGLLIGEWCSNSPKAEQKPSFLHLVFTECEEEGLVSVAPFVNRVLTAQKTQIIKKKSEASVFPIPIPFVSQTQDTVQNISFNLTGTITSGWKVGVYISWNAKAKLTHVSMNSEAYVNNIPESSKAGRFASLSNK